MMLRRLLSILIGVCVITPWAAMAQTTTTTTTTTHESSSAPVGLATSETAQINLTNLATESASGTAASCTGTIAFVNAAGTAIGTATSFTIASGVTFSATLAFATVGATARTEFRGVVTLTQTSGVPCLISSSLDTHDTTSGVTHLYLAGVFDGAGNGGGFGGGGNPGGGQGH